MNQQGGGVQCNELTADPIPLLVDFHHPFLRY